MPLKTRIFLACALPALAIGLPAHAQDSPWGPGPAQSKTPIFQEEQPVVLHADAMDYDRETDMVIASGHVEITQGETVVLADTAVYDRRNDLVFAQGNVSVLEPSGNVFFADDIDLTQRFGRGAATQFKARLADGSLFAANKAVRVNPAVTELEQAVYSPCLVVCDDGATPKTPTWQVQAQKARLNRDTYKASYEDATFDLLGLPVFYTPYFSHSLPGAPNESGILAPEMQRNTNLGYVAKLPLYWAIAPDKDLTLTPMYTSLEAPVLIGEYREAFNDGSMKLAGSVTRPDRIDAAGNRTTGTTTRGHFFGRGDFAAMEDVRWGFNVRRTTDDTYLRRYDFSNDPLLTSRLYGEGFNLLPGGRSHMSLEALAFQGMQQQDDPRRSPLVLPLADIFYETDPLVYNSRFSLNANAMGLSRTDGADSRRLSLTGRWAMPYVSEGGHIFELASQLRADVYQVSNLPLSTGSFDGEVTRAIPEASLGWRYPLMRSFGRSNLIVEPVVNAVVSPSNGNSANIPNEDSAVPEFTDTNLFSANRFAGYDRVEVGPRLNYGLRSQFDAGGGIYADGIFGQAYRVTNDPLFPISNDLRSRFSDYVGMFRVSAGPPLLLAYRFRWDKDTFSAKRDELMANFSRWGHNLNLNYIDIRNDPVLASRREVTGSVTFSLTPEWSWNVSSSRDLRLDQFTSIGTQLNYKNECLQATVSLGHGFTSDRDFRQSTTILFQVFLKNLN